MGAPKVPALVGEREAPPDRGPFGAPQPFRLANTARSADSDRMTGTVLLAAPVIALLAVIAWVTIASILEALGADRAVAWFRRHGV